MKKDRFTANPFPEVRVSEREQKELISLVDIYVDDYLKKYEHFAVVDKHQEVARDQVSIYEACASFESRTVYSALSLLETSMSSFDEENWRDV
ncbi:hypothetical protein PRIC2_014062 [Phytophthora ramorum]